MPELFCYLCGCTVHCPSVRPSLRSGSLSPVPLRGHAVTGHPWPNTTLPVSCREAHYTEPSLGLPKGLVDQKQSKAKTLCVLALKNQLLPPNVPDDSKAPCQPAEWNRCVEGNPAGSRVSAVGMDARTARPTEGQGPFGSFLGLFAKRDPP